MRLYERLADLADCLRYEDAARLRDRISSLERVIDGLSRLERLRRIERCLLAPALEPGAFDGFFVAAGRVCVRHRLSPEAVDSALAEAAAAVRDGPSCDPEHVDELGVVGSFLRRPPPELRTVALEREAILAYVGRPIADTA